MKESGEEENVTNKWGNTEEVKDEGRLAEVVGSVNTSCGRGLSSDDNLFLADLKEKVDPEIVKTTKLLQVDPKKALRSLAETITVSKQIHTDSHPDKSKISSDVHAAVKILIPKLAKTFKKLENFIIGGEQAELVDGLAIDLVNGYGEYNEISEHHEKLRPKQKNVRYNLGLCSRA